jgi:ornithine--oxo-acid transaminase
MSTVFPIREETCACDRYSQRVNPEWVRLLNLLEMNVRYERCVGAELFTSDGRRIVDFLSGYCVHAVGHNHRHVVRALERELERCGPAMIQTHVADLAGELAEKLCQKAGGRLCRAFFASSGSEGVEAAIKFARAHTRRTGILSAEHGFHGLTCGALSLMSDGFWKEGFGPLLADVKAVPFGELESLARELKTKRYAAFVVEPIPSEAGVCVPHADYLRAAESLCRRYGTLFVLDEVQTGLHRTGPFLAAHHFRVEPDMVVLAKAISGGLVPSGAVLMSKAVCDSVYSSLPRAFVHTSTFSENSLAMRAGLATLEVLEDEDLGARPKPAAICASG